MSREWSNHIEPTLRLLGTNYPDLRGRDTRQNHYEYHPRTLWIVMTEAACRLYRETGKLTMSTQAHEAYGDRPALNFGTSALRAISNYMSELEDNHLAEDAGLHL